MRLLVDHPQLASVTCADCQQWLYDLETGKRRQRRGRDAPRGDSPTPCHECPKGSPANAGLYELTPESWQTIERHYEVQATRGGCLTDAEKADRWFARLQGICEQELSRQNEASQLQLLTMVLGGQAKP